VRRRDVVIFLTEEQARALYRVLREVVQCRDSLLAVFDRGTRTAATRGYFAMSDAIDRHFNEKIDRLAARDEKKRAKP